MVKNGRYGPYVSHDRVNATLPRDKTPETITLEDAVALLDARAERAPAPRARPRKEKRAGSGTARAGKRTAKTPTAKPAKRSATKSSRKTPQAAE